MEADGCIASVTRVISGLDPKSLVECCLSAKTVKVASKATPAQLIAELDNVGWEATQHI